ATQTCNQRPLDRRAILLLPDVVVCAAVQKGAAIKVTLIAIVVAAIPTAIAIFLPWLPAADSKEADRIDFDFWFVTAICILVWAVWAEVSLYSIVAFRANPDDDTDGPPIHGHTG